MRRRIRRPPRSPPRDYSSEIRRWLAELSLAGRTVFVREEETAVRFAVSTTAVRHVFHELAGAGLLEHVPRRGWRLRPFRRKDLDDYVRVRELLELEALEAAWPRLEDRTLGGDLPGQRASRGAEERPRIDGSLHDYLIEKADNSYIRDFFRRHSQYYEILFQWESTDRSGGVWRRSGSIGRFSRRCGGATGRPPARRWRPTSATAIPCFTSD